MLRQPASTTLRLFAASALLAVSAMIPAHGQNAKVPETELMAPEALPDIPLGKADAPVTMVEYASMTCTHCAHFHETVYPTLLKDYIDTGKVRFILREFPLDPLATAGFMLARCADDKRNAVIDLLFDKQQSWAFTDKPLEGLENVLKQTGLGHDKFEACLKDQKLYDQVNEVRDRGDKAFGVTATPTFYVNGTKVTGEVNVQTLSKILDPLAGAKKS